MTEQDKNKAPDHNRFGAFYVYPQLKNIGT